MTWTDDFVECLAGNSLQDLDIEKAFQIKEGNLPKAIYKYRSLSPAESRGYSMDGILTNTVWLCSAKSYNDPYDCALKISAEEINSEASMRSFEFVAREPIVQQYVSATELNAIRAGHDPFGTIFRLVMGKLRPKAALESHDEFMRVIMGPYGNVSIQLADMLIDIMQDKIKLCSFSAVGDCPVMWSHYAGNHSGFCIEYDLQDFADTDIRRRLLSPVIYSDARFDATAYILEAIRRQRQFNPMFSVVAALRKFASWSYEQEWRLVFPGGVIKADSAYDMPRPRKVLLGLRISRQDREEILGICRRKGIKPLQMTLSSDSFSLKPEPVSF